MKEDLLKSCKKRMPVFVSIDEDADGKISLLPNAIKAGLLDPRHSHEVQRRLSADELDAARDAIIGDTLLLYPDENLHEPVDSAMTGAFKALMRRLDAAKTYGGSVLGWWRDLKNKQDEADVFKHFFRRGSS